MEPSKRGENGQRDSKGRFLPGNKGGGRPKEDRDGREMLKRALPDAIQTVLDIMSDPDAAASARLEAAKTIIERVMGKAAQPIIAELHQTDEPMTLQQMMARARELIDG